jgi:hypothetical protein
MHEAKPRSFVSLWKCLRSGPISSVERSARPCPRPSAGARVILGWRHAPSTRCHCVRRRRGRFAGGACGVELSRPDHAQLTAATSVGIQFCPPPGLCQAGERRLLRCNLPLGCKRDACIARNCMGQASRSLCPATMAWPTDWDMRKMTVAATLGVPAGSAEAIGSLGWALAHAIMARRPHHHFRLPKRQQSCTPRSAGPSWARS